ncbi:mercuric ion transport protein [Serratia fonticola]|uniref:Mercuric transport protein MerT n=1 Tax=Serratia fonticola TaxID=47917 RepID=A0A542D1Y2_SERFO|nr:mercuric transporter MerT family protein [Serratia fonticola]TQI80879.1 mercuric ion transport protein [Serratia fonticola]TQI97096.1 mercuric ion transport protein [Serratia fonticola]TVZ71592.1 mercuric ion transport protein [Serratia fonticola]
MTTSLSNSVKESVVTLVAALLAAAASTLCCLGPLLYLVFGISAAGLTGISAFSWLQWPMTALAIGLMVRGFWRLYLSPRPVCVNVVSRRTLLWLYWLSVPLVVVMITYPYVLPWLLELME